MKMAHMLFVYKDPEQVARLVKKLSHPNFDFYIHVDAKIDQRPFEFLESIDRVYLVKKRIKVRWAGLSFTQAIFNTMQEISGMGRKYDFFNAMSGQDYPLVSTQNFYTFFERQPGKNFLAIEKEGSDWWQHAYIRVHKYHFTDFDFKGRYAVQFVLNKIMPRRKIPFNYTLYGSNRATWWTISGECAAYLLEFVAANPKVMRYAKFTWAPDEYLIATLVMNSRFRETVVPENYRYIDWSLGGSNPKILTADDFDALKKTDKLLARKFDVKTDTKILDLLDEVTQ
jgi:hypothetical protein